MLHRRDRARAIAGMALAICLQLLPVASASAQQVEEPSLSASEVISAPDALPLPAETPAEPVAPPHIEWQVENPFRLFKDAAQTEMFRTIYGTLSDAEAVAPVLSSERRLAPLFPHGWAKSIYTRTCWRGSANRYGPCKDGDDYINPREHRVAASVDGLGPGATDCEWYIGPVDQPIISSSSNVVRINKPCGSAVLLDIPYPAGARVSVFTGGSPLAETVIKVTDLFIVGIGDSYGSGEGNPDLPVEFAGERAVDYGSGPDGSALDGYPARVGDWESIGDQVFIDSGARWHNQSCHRSLYSYQLRAALQLAIEDPHRAVTYVGFACAGAEVIVGLFQRYKGTEWAPHPPDLPQLGAVSRSQCGDNPVKEEKVPTAYTIGGEVPRLRDVFVTACPRSRSRPIDLIFVSIGGNDIGFSSIVANAVLLGDSMLRQLGGWMGQVSTGEEAIGKLKALRLAYKALNRALHAQLHIPWSESDRIILTAYPKMGIQADGEQVCPSGTTGMEVFPGFDRSNANIDEGEQVSEALHLVMKQSAVAFDWTYVDRHRTTFAGHSVCDGTIDPKGPIAEQLSFPRRVDGLWFPYNPSWYEPYASRRRWFRTPNDAFLTGNFHLEKSVLKSVLSINDSAIQVLLASTYSGAFHPTAEGHAAMADAVVEKAREIIERRARPAVSSN